MATAGGFGGVAATAGDTVVDAETGLGHRGDLLAARKDQVQLLPVRVGSFVFEMSTQPVDERLGLDPHGVRDVRERPVCGRSIQNFLLRVVVVAGHDLIEVHRRGDSELLIIAFGFPYGLPAVGVFRSRFEQALRGGIHLDEIPIEQLGQMLEDAAAPLRLTLKGELLFQLAQLPPGENARDARSQEQSDSRARDDTLRDGADDRGERDQHEHRSSNRRRTAATRPMVARLGLAMAPLPTIEPLDDRDEA